MNDAVVFEKQDKAEKRQQKILHQKRLQNKNLKNQFAKTELKKQTIEEKVKNNNSSIERDVVFRKEAAKLRAEEI